jgi:hypothetical protein
MNWRACLRSWRGITRLRSLLVCGVTIRVTVLWDSACHRASKSSSGPPFFGCVTQVVA